MIDPAPSFVFGADRPRIAPPRPMRADIAAFTEAATACGIELMPWQAVAATYIEALGPDDRWLYPEVAAVVSRQNGKTELLVPHIVRRLRMGRKIMHAAQKMDVPRETFYRVASIMSETYGDELAKVGRQSIGIRYGSGQESIRMRNGGLYRIVAATRGGARGPANDDLIIDEAREFEDNVFLAAAEPTLSQSPNPQVLFTSNAGEDTSDLLNGIKRRAGADPSLAYLEWSAAPERDVADREGWREGNPAIGRLPGRDMMAHLERKYESYRLAGTLGIFETEHLCRWVSSTRERFVDEYLWSSCMGPLGEPASPVMAVSMTPDGSRAAAALAWQRPDGSVALRLIYDVTGNPIDVKRLGEDMETDAARLGVKRIGYDPLTDAELAKHFEKRSEKVMAKVFANASAQFVNLVTAKRIRWQDGDGIGADLAYTARKTHDETGHFEAVRMTDDRPIPAALASIRAVWLASGPDAPSPRVY